MSKWAKLSELDSCFFAKACLSWSKLHSCTDMSRAFSEPRLSNFAHLSDSWVIQEYFVCDGSLSRLYFTKKKSLIGSLYRLGGSIRFGYCAIPCFGGLCEERLPCFCGLSEIKSLSVIHLYPKSWGDFPFFSLPLHASSSHKHELHPCNQVDNFLVLQCPQQHSPCQAIVCGSRVRCGGRVHSGKRLQQARLLQSLPCSRQGGVIWRYYISNIKT